MNDNMEPKNVDENIFIVNEEWDESKNKNKKRSGKSRKQI